MGNAATVSFLCLRRRSQAELVRYVITIFHTKSLCTLVYVTRVVTSIVKYNISHFFVDNDIGRVCIRYAFFVQHYGLRDK